MGLLLPWSWTSPPMSRSPSPPRTAPGSPSVCRIRHVAVNDSPHSLVAGKLSLPLSHHLMTPWIIPYSAWSVFGVSRSQITRYRALGPGGVAQAEARAGLASGAGSGERASQGHDPREARGVLRPLSRGQRRVVDGESPGEARARLSWATSSWRCARYADQLESIKKKFGSSFTVPEHVVDGAGMIERSDVFVGMGGTMTTEAALLGVPAISAFQGAELYTERYLLSKRLLLKARSVAAVSGLRQGSLGPRLQRSATTAGRAALLDWMEDPAPKSHRATSRALPPSRMPRRSQIILWLYISDVRSIYPIDNQ